MAVDTAEKRFSMMSFGQPFNKLRPPTGSVDAAERATLLDLYSGIALASPGGAVSGLLLLTRPLATFGGTR